MAGTGIFSSVTVQTGFAAQTAYYYTGIWKSFSRSKAARHETNHCHSPSSKIKNVWNYTSTYPCLHNKIFKHRDKLPLFLPLWSPLSFGVDSRIHYYGMKSGKYFLKLQADISDMTLYLSLVIQLSTDLINCWYYTASKL